MNRWSRVSILWATVAWLVSPQALLAQNPEPAPPPPVSAHTGVRGFAEDIERDFGGLASVESAIVLGVGGGLAALAHTQDATLNQHLSGSSYSGLGPGKWIGNAVVQMGGALTVYGIGRARDPHGTMAKVGRDLFHTQIVTQSVTFAIKTAVRRERPDHSNKRAFPSGHASTTFATAAVMDRYFGWRVAVPSYVMASYVSASRLRANRHHLSDVVFGAAVGVWAGRAVPARHARSGYSWMPTPVPGGVAVLVTRVDSHR